MSYASASVADGGTSAIIPCSPKSDNFKVAFMITPDTSATVTVEVCLQPFKRGEVPSPVRWAPLEDFNATAYSAPVLGNVWGPITAIRFRSTTGAFTYDIQQGGAL